MSLTILDLLAAGYREFPPTATHLASRAFQKCLPAPGGGKLLFVNVFWYARGDGHPGGFQPESQLKLPDGTFLNLVWIIGPDDIAVADIEAKFLDMHQRLGALPYSAD